MMLKGGKDWEIGNNFVDLYGRETDRGRGGCGKMTWDAVLDRCGYGGLEGAGLC